MHFVLGVLMHLSLWNPLSHCVTLIIHKKPNVSGHEHSEQPEEPDLKTGPTRAQLEFLESTTSVTDHTYASEDSIPDINQSFSKFLIMYPEYGSTEEVDHIRSNEYLPKVCLDYCGFGLFSFVQTVHYWESCSFHLSEITANLINYARSGGAVKGTMEHDIKTRILDYMNISEDEYEVVFTVSRGSAFKLLAESYPFEVKKKLLTMFDHESQSVNWMCQFAKQRGAKVENAWFKWPTFQVCATDLRQQITGKKKKRKSFGASSGGAGLFVFPVQSRVTGTKYSYQWMSLAQENNWHVLLDAGALGPKDMDSLGLSLFRPEFIITSFYKVFGYDPSGFGCLLIKKSMIGSLRNQPGHTGTGIVKINPVFPSYFSDSIEGSPGLTGPGPGLGIHGNGEVSENGPGGPGPQMPVFSGAYTSDQVREVFDTEMEDDKYFEIEETGSFSVDDVLKSPVFSEDGSPDDPFWIDLGRSPAGSDGGCDSTQPGPPVWFSGRNKTEHACSPKTTLNAIKSPKVMLVNEIEEATKVVKERSPKVGSNSESAIRRETEGEFRLLGRREVNILATNIEDIDYASDDIDVEELTRQEPEISCRHLDHVDTLGLHKTTLRLRFLVNWLVTSLLQLRIRSTDQVSVPLVHIYGPKVKFERGGAVAFNIRDKNKKLVNPETVQKLAETNGVSLGIAILSNIRVEGKEDDAKSGLVRVEVVTCSLGFLSDFSDVYKLWAFVAKFMNPGFMKGGLTTVVEDE